VVISRNFWVGIAMTLAETAIRRMLADGESIAVEFKIKAPCDMTGAPERTALRELRDMVDRGLIVVHGKTRSARYYLP
jgi:hypothetical protein